MSTQTAVELRTIEPGVSSTAGSLLKSTPPNQIQELPVEGPHSTLPTEQQTPDVLSKGRTVLVITQLIGVQLFTSFCNGIIVVSLPAIAQTLNLPSNLLLWPTAVFYLTAGSCLMMAGSIADVLGTRPVILSACVLLVASSLACGLSRTGSELIAFRALQGVTTAMAVPASVSVISTSIEDGRPRNLGFACLGFSGPLGFLTGLILGGVFADTVGWRSAFYLGAAASFALTIIGFLVLPGRNFPRPANMVGKRLASEIDWVGAGITSTGLAILSYVLAMLSSDIHNIQRPQYIVLLVASISCVPAFIWWMNRQVKCGRPALIPNSLWRKSSFTCICVMILFTSAVSNSMELFGSLFFQQVQGHSALGASLRILPALIMAIVTNVFTGLIVNRVPIIRVVLVASALSAASPLIMALIDPQWSYWYAAFFAQVLQPLCPDVLFTVGLLIVSAVFPLHTQALSGAVFETCSQLGTSIGLTITAVISTSRTAASTNTDKTSPTALMDGYRAVFWTLFAWTLLVLFVGAGGLRRLGVIGAKKD